MTKCHVTQIYSDETEKYDGAALHFGLAKSEFTECEWVIHHHLTSDLRRPRDP